MSKVIGIISYFPDKQPDRDLRIDRFNSLLLTLDRLFKGIPILVVAQNWKDYVPNRDIISYKFDKLGILMARRTLRELFLLSNYENMITMDDDVMISGESGNLFLKQIDDNPNSMGVFCWEHSQLNLLYISKHIYSQVDLPDIDPEKDQGFEDVVFTYNCKQLFPNNVFTFMDTGLTETSFRYTGPDKVPSTWAGGYHDWKKLRGNTKKIKESIEKNVILGNALSSVINPNSYDNTPIDLVVPYVNSNDANWKELFNKYVPNVIKEDSNGKQRFRENLNFKYFFRGIEKYTPWINNVFLLVQSKSQVPDWLNTDNVRVILHEEFIPYNYLPVFSSQAIEMFLHLIPGLSERFLYANDDIYFIGDLKPEDYFIGNKVRTSFKVASLSNILPLPLWQSAIINSGLLVNKKETIELKNRGQYIVPMHSTRPYFKSKIIEVENLYKDKILNSISMFRESHNFTVYLYDLYLRRNGFTVDKTYGFNHYGSKSLRGLIANSLINPGVYKVMCLNDSNEELDLERESFITDRFDKKFPLKSKYEV